MVQEVGNRMARLGFAELYELSQEYIPFAHPDEAKGYLARVFGGVAGTARGRVSLPGFGQRPRQYLGIDVKQLYRQVELGKVKPLRGPRNSYRFTQDNVGRIPWQVKSANSTTAAGSATSLNKRDGRPAISSTSVWPMDNKRNESSTKETNSETGAGAAITIIREAYATAAAPQLATDSTEWDDALKLATRHMRANNLRAPRFSNTNWPSRRSERRSRNPRDRPTSRPQWPNSSSSPAWRKAGNPGRSKTTSTT